MSSTSKKRMQAKPAASRASRPPLNERPVAASRLRAQTRRLLGKHYRAKYGVR